MSDDGGNCWEELRDAARDAAEGARPGLALESASSWSGSVGRGGGWSVGSRAGEGVRVNRGRAERLPGAGRQDDGEGEQGRWHGINSVIWEK